MMGTRSEDYTKHNMTMWFLGMLLCLMVVKSSDAQLSENFYAKTCPNVEQVVQQAVTTKFQQQFTTAQATLRLFFHDCFVGGCDASMMISSPKNDADKDAPDNLSLAGDGYDTVIKAKAAVEAQCPGVVSCADILALATRDVIALVGGPGFEVELGRRDGLISKASRVDGTLPKPELDVKGLMDIFGRNGLSLTDMVALSGAHTIGVSHCDQFSNRLYNFSQFMPVDPTLDPTYARQLMQTCPRNNPTPDIPANLDPVTPNTFDNLYFQNLVNRKGLLSSDQVLFTDLSTQPTVLKFANNPGEFNNAFISAMRNLGRVGILVGNVGEIRKDCTAFN